MKLERKHQDETKAKKEEEWRGSERKALDKIDSGKGKQNEPKKSENVEPWNEIHDDFEWRER